MPETESEARAVLQHEIFHVKSQLKNLTKLLIDESRIVRNADALDRLWNDRLDFLPEYANAGLARGRPRAAVVAEPDPLLLCLPASSPVASKTPYD